MVSTEILEAAIKSAFKKFLKISLNYSKTPVPDSLTEYLWKNAFVFIFTFKLSYPLLPFPIIC